MNEETVRAMADQLRQYATHFAPRVPDDPDMRPGRVAMARAAIRNYNASPDGILDNGCIITLWEETGEYLQYVQPSVGELLADLMDAHPDLPEVQAIAVEMKRINDDYGRRVGGEAA